MQNNERSYRWLWLSVTLFPLLLIALLLPLSPYDYWWYLRLGQDIAQTGAVPTIDTYSYTRAGTPIFYQSWLAALGFWKSYEVGGLLLTFFLRALIIGITYSLLWFLLLNTGVDLRLGSLLVFCAALAGSNNWSFRPQLFTYPLFALALVLLSRWNRGENRGLWLLVLLSILWVNLHGSFPLLFILGASALLFGYGDKKQLAIILGISAAALLMNPYGINVFPYVLNMLSSPSNRFYSNEWLPTVNSGWQTNLFFVGLLTFIPLAAFSPRKLSMLEWIWFLSFGWMALIGIRYVIWFLFLLAYFTAILLSGWGARFTRSPLQDEKPLINIFAACLLLLLPFGVLPGLREAWWSGAPRPYDGDNPIKATAWLAAHPEFEGPLWSDFSHSSYLIFALPSRPVWIDTRFELYPPEKWQEYIAIASASSHWQELLDKEGIQLVMLSMHGEPSLISAMRASDQWCKNYHDEDAVIFSRKGSAQCP